VFILNRIQKAVAFYASALGAALIIVIGNP
jgi:hypothetical protein